jgi:hypothetical protein
MTPKGLLKFKRAVAASTNVRILPATGAQLYTRR